MPQHEACLMRWRYELTAQEDGVIVARVTRGVTRQRVNEEEAPTYVRAMMSMKNERSR